MRIDRIGAGFVVVAGLLAVSPAFVQERSVPSPACRELARRVEGADAGALELNAGLFRAAATGCLPVARRLIEAGASLAARDRLGAMPLAHAARAGHTAVVEFFLAKGAAIDARNLVGSTALFGAAENGQQPVVALLLAKGADPNLPGRSDVTPLAAAAFRGNDGAAAELIAHGARPDAADATGKAPIVYAAARGFTAVVRRLLAAGVDARRAYGNDLTALMWAAGYEDGADRRRRQPRPDRADDRGRAGPCGPRRSAAGARRGSHPAGQGREARARSGDEYRSARIAVGEVNQSPAR
jgi:hypothetical protein